jgi:putative peptidoglycan binding protein
MKSIVVIALFLALGVMPRALADDIVRANAGKQHAGQPSPKVNNAKATAGVRNSTGQAAKNRIGIQPNMKLRQNYPALIRPVTGAPLAMNVQRTLPHYQPTEMPNRPVRDRNVSGTNGRAKTGGGNSLAATGNRRSYFDALKRCRHERHDRHWWNQHCRTIVFVNTGYYYLDSGYWYPAYGYSPTYDYYDSDGPIYTYGDLLPDQVIANVQAALREAGYYVGPITGSLGPATRAAISNFQRDYGLIITGAIDEPTVQSLGLN